MAKISISLKGIRELQQTIERKKNLTPVREIVDKYGAELKNKTVANMSAAYTAGYSTGATALSVTKTFSNGGLTVTVAPHTKYFSYLEYGTRFMSAKPTLKPAFACEAVKFVNDLQKLVK